MAVYIYNMQYVISYIIHDTNQMIKVIGYILCDIWYMLLIWWRYTHMLRYIIDTTYMICNYAIWYTIWIWTYISYRIHFTYMADTHDIWYLIYAIYIRVQLMILIYDTIWKLCEIYTLYDILYNIYTIYRIYDIYIYTIHTI